MEGAEGGSPKFNVWTWPWRVLRFFGRIVARFFIVVGVLTALAVLVYVKFEVIVETIDSRYASDIDAYLGIDKATIDRLRAPAYFAQQSVVVTEDQKTVACISSPLVSSSSIVAWSVSRV